MTKLEKLKKWLFHKRFRIIYFDGYYHIQKQDIFGFWEDFGFNEYVYENVSSGSFEKCNDLFFPHYETFAAAKADLALYLTYIDDPRIDVGYHWFGIYHAILIRKDIKKYFGGHHTIVVYPCTKTIDIDAIVRLEDYETLSVSDNEKYYEY